MPNPIETPPNGVSPIETAFSPGAPPTFEPPKNRKPPFSSSAGSQSPSRSPTVTRRFNSMASAGLGATDQRTSAAVAATAAGRARKERTNRHDMGGTSKDRERRNGCKPILRTRPPGDQPHGALEVL